MVLAAVAAGLTTVVVAPANAAEAALVPGLRSSPVATPADLVAVLRARCPAGRPPTVLRPRAPTRAPTWPTWWASRGPPGRSRSPPPAVTTCCCRAPPGRARPCWPSGCPGCCRRSPTSSALEVTAVHSVAGMLPAGARWSLAAVPGPAPHGVGPGHGGRWGGVPRPGAVSLAHRGVLFLDEAPEFGSGGPRRAAPAAGDRPGGARPRRGHGALPGALPAGPGGQPLPVRALGGRVGCSVHTAGRSAATRRRLSGPLLDRIDLRLAVDRARGRTARDGGGGAQRRSWSPGSWWPATGSRTPGGHPWTANAEVPGPELRAGCPRPRTCCGCVTSRAGPADRPGGRPRHAGGLDPGRPGRARRPRSTWRPRCGSGSAGCGARRDRAGGDDAAARQAWRRRG